MNKKIDCVWRKIEVIVKLIVFNILSIILRILQLSALDIMMSSMQNVAVLFIWNFCVSPIMQFRQIGSNQSFILLIIINSFEFVSIKSIKESYDYILICMKKNKVKHANLVSIISNTILQICLIIIIIILLQYLWQIIVPQILGK